MAWAAKNGLSKVPQILEEVKAPWDGELPNGRLKWSSPHTEYLVERKYDKYDVLACFSAAMNGHLDCLKYLRETTKHRGTVAPFE